MRIFPAIIMVFVFFLVSGCYLYQSDPIFGDCDTFLSYHDACVRFMDSYDDSVCWQKYEDYPDIPSSDVECYPKVECSTFFEKEQTKQWLRRCRYVNMEEKCVLSFDVTCEGWHASDRLLSLKIMNKMDTHIKDVSLQIVSDIGTYDCRDSDNDAILAVNETDTFYCTMPIGDYLDATVLIGYEDYRSGARSNKKGNIVLVR